MLDCRQDMLVFVLLTWLPPHTLDTIWTKKVYLGLIRPQDMVLVIHVLSLLVFSKLFAAFLCSIFRRGFLLGGQLCRPTWCSVRRMVWALTGWPPTPSTSAAMLAALIRLWVLCHEVPCWTSSDQYERVRAIIPNLTHLLPIHTWDLVTLMSHMTPGWEIANWAQFGHFYLGVYSLCGQWFRH